VTVSREVTALFTGFDDKGNMTVIVPAYCSRTKIAINAKSLPPSVLECMYNKKPVRAMLHTQRNQVMLNNWEVIND